MHPRSVAPLNGASSFEIGSDPNPLALVVRVEPFAQSRPNFAADAAGAARRSGRWTEAPFEEPPLFEMTTPTAKGPRS